MADPRVKRSREPGSAAGRLSAPAAARQARSHLEQLTGHACESISALGRTETGWEVTVEVLELERVPRTTDLMASYRVEVDDRGELVGYERLERYSRGQALSDCS